MTIRPTPDDVSRAYTALVEAFREHGTYWNCDENEGGYELRFDTDAGKLLRGNGYFSNIGNSRAQIEAASSVIGEAAREAGNHSPMFPADDDPDFPPNYWEAVAMAVSVPMCTIIDGSER